MSKENSKKLDYLPFKTWPDRIGTCLVIFGVSATCFTMAFGSSLNYPISHEDAICALKSWGFWVPDGTNASRLARIVINCELPGGQLIKVSQPSDWTPPVIGSDIKIDIVKYRLFGQSVYVK